MAGRRGRPLDLAADGAEAAGILVALTVPPDAGDDDVVAAMTGAGAAAAEVGARVVGGDLSSVLGGASPSRCSGGPRRRSPVPARVRRRRMGHRRARRTARRAGIVAARRGARRRGTPRLRAPRARLYAGRWLARHGARAMLD